MPLCTFYSLRIILMTVIFLHASKSGNIKNFVVAAPLPSNSESRNDNIQSALKETAINEHQGAPEKGLEGAQLQDTGDVKEELTAFTLNEEPIVPTPQNVQLAFIDISSVLITWKYSGVDHTQFVVQMSYDGDPYRNVSVLLNSTQFLFMGMKFSAYYQFQVIAYDSGVPSAPAETNYFINGVTAPPGPPHNVEAILKPPDVISLMWSAPPTPSPVIYLVEWGTNKTLLDRDVTVSQSTHFSFKNLEPGQTYYFRVTADINSWLSVPSPTVNMTTSSPNLPPVVVHTNVSDMWAFIAWSDPSEDRYPTSVDEFQIRYGQLQDKNYFNRTESYTNVSSVGSSGRTFNLTDLAPGSEWVVEVAYTSGKFLSNWSAAVFLETLEDITCSACEPVSSTQLRVRWQVVTSTSDRNRTVRVLEAGLLVSEVSTSLAGGELTVSGLHPWTSHSFAIVLGTTPTGLPPEPCPVINCWTKEAAPSQPPTHVTATSLSPHSILLIWSQPPLNSQNGLITKYTIGYQCTPKFPGQECKTHQLETGADRPYNVSLVIGSLEPFTMYSFFVSASTSAGKGPFSFPSTVLTREEAPDAPPTIISVANITATSFLISWIPPTLSHQNGIITNYHISLATGCHTVTPESETTGTESGQEAERIIVQNGTKNEVYIDGLQPDTIYVVWVSAETAGGESPSSDAICLSTLKSVGVVPVDVNFTATLTSSTVNEPACYSVNFWWEWPQTFDSFTTEEISVLEWSVFIKYKSSNESDDEGGEILVGENVRVRTSTVSSLNESTILTNGQTVLFWLEIDVTLSNDTVLSLLSQPEHVTFPLCGTTGSYADRWLVALLSTVGALLTCILLLFLTVCCCGCLCYKLKKIRRAGAQPSIGMTYFIPTEENDYLLDPTLRISDGRSSVSSSSEEESTRTSSDSLNVASDASIIGQCHSDNDSDLLDLTVESPQSESSASSPLGHASGMSAQMAMPKEPLINLDRVEAESRPHDAHPLAPRQNPDGCSLSSSASSESLALLVDQ